MQPPGVRGEDAYRRLLEAARADPAVLGVVLTGSRARGSFVRDGSDWDVRVFVGTDLSGATQRYGTPHGSPVEAVVMPLEVLEAIADPTSEHAWDRYSYVHATVAVDKSDGAFADLITRLETLSPEAARDASRIALDGYINSYYRSLKNERVGLTAESHLDAAESIPPLLTALFAIHGRVRPFNRFLAWELETYPLPGVTWAGSELLPRLSAILSNGSTRTQAALFRDVEALARAAGHADVVDSWEPDVGWLRSGRPG